MMLCCFKYDGSMILPWLLCLHYFLTVRVAWSQRCLFYGICYYELLLLNIEKKQFKLFELLIPMHVSVFVRDICGVFGLNILIVSLMASTTNFASQLRSSE